MCRPLGRSASFCVGSLRIVQQRLHVLYGRRKCDGRHGGPVAVEGHDVHPARCSIREYEDLTPAFGAQVEQLVPGAAQEAGEIKIARLERDHPRRNLVLACPVDTSRSPQKNSLSTPARSARAGLRGAAGRVSQDGCASPWWKRKKPG